MRRRALLGALTTALAGCSGSRPFADPTATPTAPRPEMARRLGVVPERTACPVHDDDDVAQVVCAPETDPESIPLALRADSETGSLPEATFTFTLFNRTNREFRTNFAHWRLSKRVDGSWFRIAPNAWVLPQMTLEPGQSHEWRLVCQSALPELGSTAKNETDGHLVGGLGGGEYAFTTEGHFPEDGHERTTQVGVLFSLDGPNATLEPTASVAATERDGDTVTVRDEQPEDDTKTRKYILTRVDEGDTDHRLLPEQAARDPRFRNTLPYFDPGVTTVRYVHHNNRGYLSGFDDGDRFAYGEDQFRFEERLIEG